MHEHIGIKEISKNFTSIKECIDFIVPYVRRDKIVIVDLNTLVTDKGIVISNMHRLGSPLVYDLDNTDEVTYNELPFGNGQVYDQIKISKHFGWVTSRNEGLGTVVSIDLDVTVYPCKNPFEEKGEEYEPAIRFL